MTTDGRTSDLQRLRTVLDLYGSDDARWPADDRATLLRLIASDRDAALLHRNAARLDALLTLAPAAKPSRDERVAALQKNILADFTRERGSPQEGQDESDGQNRNNVLPFPSSRMLPAGSDKNRIWMTAAALAACFLFGVFLGGNGLGNWQLDPVSTITGLSNTTNEQSTEIGDLIVSAGLEEDLL